MTRILNKLGNKATNFNIVKVIYNKPTGNIILSDESLKSLTLNGKKSECTYST